jgi:uncharacterized membrane protein
LELGLFYYNKEDKRIFPPKRMAWAGWTVIANPISVAVLAIVLIIIIGIISPQKNNYPYYYYDTLFNGNKF